MRMFVSVAALCVLVFGGSFSAALARGEKDDVDETIKTNWVCYFEFPNGKKILANSVAGISADLTKQEDYWWNVKYSQYSGPKQRIAIYSFENNVTGGWRDKVQVDALEEQLDTEFLKTNRWIVVKRKDVGLALNEQDFGASGRVAKESAAKIGSVLGAQFGVKASVTEFEPGAAGFGGAAGGAGRGGAGIAGLKRERAELAINIQIFDTTTTEITASVQKRGWAATWGVGGGGIGATDGGGVAGGAAGGFSKTPIGRAVQSCMAKAVYDMVTGQLKDKVWQGRVMQAKDGKIYVNAGEALGMRPGMKLKVLGKGEDLVDPETGLVLGSETKALGTCAVLDVKEKFSIASVVDGCEGCKAGDIVEFAGQ